MPHLKLIRLECKQTTDGIGSDHILIKKDNDVIHQKFMDKKSVSLFHGDPHHSFADNVSISFWEVDKSSSNDHLGTVNINKDRQGNGEQFFHVMGHGSSYYFYYIVT